MMKNRKTLFLDALRNIINRKVAFLSIIAIMMLGVGGLMCIFNLGESLNKHSNRFYKAHNLKDLEMVASMGITDEDITEIKAMEGVKDAEGVFRSGVVLQSGDKFLDATAISETKRINTITVDEGKMPENPGECALNEIAMNDLKVKTGDTVRITSVTVSGLIKSEEFTVTAKITHPEYITVNEDLILLPDSEFDKDAVYNHYLAAYVKMDVPESEDLFSGSYKKKLTTLRNRLEEYAEEHSRIKTTDIKDEANKELADEESKAKEALSEGRQKLEDGEKELKDGLKSAEEQLNDSEKQLSDGKKKLEEELAKAEKELRDKEAEFKQKLADALKQIEDGEQKANAEFEAARKQLDDGEEQYRNGVAKYEDGKRQYEEGVKKFEEARQKLDDAERQIQDGESKIREGIRSKSEELQEYAVIVNALLEELEKRFGDIEEKYPDLVGNEYWEDLKKLVYEKDRYADIIKNGTDDEVIDCMDEIVRRTKEDYENLPMREEVRLLLAAIFDAVRNRYPEPFAKLEQLVDSIAKIQSAKKEYEEGKAKYEEELKKADLPGAEAKLKEAKEQLDAGRAQLNDGWDQYNRKKNEVGAQLADAKAQYEKGKADGERQLADAWAKFYKTKKEKEKELLDAEIKLEEGRDEYEKTKAEKEEELKEGWDEFYKKEKEADEKLKEAEEKVSTMDDYNYIVNPRDLVSSFLQVDSSIKSIYVFAALFVPLFSLVAILVCFSTIAIIVDDQKRQIGGVKALGFYNREISFKYIVFAFAGTMIGNTLGIGLGMILTKLVANPVAASYAFGKMPQIISFVPLIAIYVGTITLASVVAWRGCSGLVKCSAIGLINGSEPVRKAMKSKSTKKSDGKSLYSRLLFRNIRMDSARVIVSVIVIFGSVALIGFGYTVRFAYTQAVDIQVNKLNHYEFQAVFDDDALGSFEDIKNIVEKRGGRTLESCYSEGLIDMDGSNEGICLIALHPDENDDFLLIRDKRGRAKSVPEEGILIPIKYAERLKGKKEVYLYDTKLYRYKADVAGDYLCYLGCVAVLNEKTYESVFHKEYVPNCLYIQCDPGDTDSLKEEILNVNDNIRILNPNFLVEKGENVNSLFDAVTVICVGLAVLLSFMILINFTGILVNRRMKEMLVMRINGYSVKQVISYVARESAIITVIGIAVGILFGAGFSYVAVHLMENVHVMYNRTPYPPAWLYASLFNIGFTVIIDILSFRKISKVPLTDVGKY